ncbi:MAG: NAD(P)H-binding protein [Pseudomonadales bacterium]|nr:NAD(P)H-binding protein [Pseudomonadales bacterium]
MEQEIMAGSPRLLWVGCGKLGAYSCARLLDAGWNVTATRRSQQRLAELPLGVQGLVLDALDANSQTALVQTPWDAVVITLSAASNAEAYRRVYVEGTAALLAALQHNPAKPHILFASSTSVYAQSDGSTVDEQSATEPQGYSGRCMLEAEALLAASALPATSIRFSGIYGGGRSNHLLNVLRDGRICPRQPVHFSNRIHSADCAKVFAHLLARAVNGKALASLYLACDGASAALREVMEWLARQQGIDPAQLRDDYRPGRGGNRRCVPRRLQQEGFHFSYPSFREGFEAV